ncbi:MAG: helix-turn-helix domain-containing protein [Spirochaetales bacterium]|nr:helix-turn-helix domain-containing protein [Spirochaetales bacterium]
MKNNSQFIKIRRKKLGALIKDARFYVDKTPQECAQIMHVTDLRYLDYEYGVLSPSLPEIEVFAYHLNTPLDHFWGNTTLSDSLISKDDIDNEKLIRLRQRIIGAKIRQAREEVNLSLDDLSYQVNIPDSQIKTYELGKVPIPLPELEVIANIFNVPIKFFFDNQGPIGNWELQQQTQNYFSELPPELVSFIIKPVNRPYIELAQRLSEMSAEKLRAVAEGLLEITL